MTLLFEVENIKCDGCAGSIRRRLRTLDGVAQVDVDVAGGSVRVEAPEALRPALADALAGIGYPERGSVAGLSSAGAKARSFVSCAIGRLDSDD